LLKPAGRSSAAVGRCTRNPGCRAPRW
jgi:hypothetical protein